MRNVVEVFTFFRSLIQVKNEWHLFQSECIILGTVRKGEKLTNKTFNSFQFVICMERSISFLKQSQRS